MKAFAWIASVFASKAAAVPAAPVVELSSQELQAVAGGLPRVGGLDLGSEPNVVANVTPPATTTL